ncbi:hypothetical protein JND45_15655 [Listeria monocytogenes]|nr:hypothetical protein [Listeria monocytogenes]
MPLAAPVTAAAAPEIAVMSGQLHLDEGDVVAVPEHGFPRFSQIGTEPSRDFRHLIYARSQNCDQ